MSSAGSAANTAASNAEERRRQILQQGAVQFQIKTGGARYICKVMDRPTLERTRTASTSASSTSSPVDSGANSFVSK